MQDKESKIIWIEKDNQDCEDAMLSPRFLSLKMLSTSKKRVNQ